MVYDISKLCYGGTKMFKAILKDVLLATIAIVAQVGMNTLNHKENDWFLIVFVGVMLGVADFVISYMKGKLESINYTIEGLTKGTTKFDKQMNARNKRKRGK